MERIEVIAERCKSCGYCVKFCPNNVLEIGKTMNSKGFEYVVPARLDDCVSCCICARICPDGAINVYK